MGTTSNFNGVATRTRCNPFYCRSIAVGGFLEDGTSLDGGPNVHEGERDGIVS